MPVKVKICGVTRVEDADMACKLGADMIGVNFYAGSPRCVSVEHARELKAAIKARAQVVGVFVNAPRDYIESVRAVVGLDFIQFHGNEADDAIAGWRVPVIRAVRLRSASDLARLGEPGSHFVLLDSFDPVQFGGTGRGIAPAQLNSINLSRVFVAGGLNPENVGAFAALNPYAVDVASGVESGPGIKDHSKMRSFIRNAKST